MVSKLTIRVLITPLWCLRVAATYVSTSTGSTSPALGPGSGTLRSARSRELIAETSAIGPSSVTRAVR
jgi:hypothetical protein